MSDNDLIRRGDAKALCDQYPYVEGVKNALEDLPAVTVGVRDFDVEVVRGNTGGNLALYFNDHRVAGSKPWGGGTPIYQFRVQGDDAKSAGILATIRDFQTVPVVKECLTTDAALPAVTPAPDAAAIREAWGKAYWRMRSYAIHDNDCKLNKPPHFNGPCSCGLTAALEEALALITKGGDGRRVYMGQIMAECDCPREAECQAAGRCIAEGRR